MAENKTVRIEEILSANELAEALRIWRRNTTPAQEIADKIIAPIIGKINQRTGQENDPKYLAYAVENIFNQTMVRK